ncbi:hypothetical protein JCM5350_001367 [Sporobolomyces pararoseus]
MTPLTTLPRLPDELIIEVFRSECLEESDLFNCSLVSRKFVEAASELLYRHISITIFEGQPESESESESEEEEDDDDNDVFRCEYSHRTWKLLRTLMDHSKLKQLVQSIKFTYYGPNKELGETALETSPSLAISSFLRLCRNVKKVEFDDGWVHSIVQLKLIKQLVRVENLVMEEMTVEEAEFINRQLTQLQNLHASTFPYTSPASPNPNQIVRYPSNLRSLSLLGGPFQLHKAFVSTNYSTLQQLWIPIDVARRLDYEQLSQLHTLRLENSYGPRERPLHYIGTKFWTSLSKSRSLRCLILFGGKYSDGYEEVLFGPNQVHSTTSIPTLKTIRFGEGVYLDRVNLLLSGPIGATLHQVVVWEYFVEKDRDVFTKNTFNFLSGICQERGIEVVIEPGW